MPTKKAKPADHVELHKDGSTRAKGQMVNGIPVGYWEWFRKSGAKMRSGHFEDNGEQVGDWTTYDSNGAVYKVTTMKPKPKPKAE